MKKHKYSPKYSVGNKVLLVTGAIGYIHVIGEYLNHEPMYLVLDSYESVPTEQHDFEYILESVIKQKLS